MRIRLNVGDTGLKAVLAGAKTSLDPAVVVQYYDGAGEYAVPVALDGVTSVTLLAAPTEGRRVVTGLSLYNRDTGAITVTFTAVLAAGTYYLLKQTLQSDETLIVSEDSLNVIDSTGRVKSSFVAGTSVDVQMASAGQIVDSNGNELIQFPATVSSAVNEVTVTNAAAGSAPSLTATGGDTDINLSLGGKGAGFVTTSTPFQKRSSTAVTATTGGGTTGLIPAGSSLVIVTSDSANKQISLPAASVGDEIEILVGTTGCELISAVAAHKVNEVTVGATNELALTAESLYRCKYTKTNYWIVTGTTKLGAAEAALVPDAL